MAILNYQRVRSWEQTGQQLLCHAFLGGTPHVLTDPYRVITMQTVVW
jgi:hypothetical protein